MGNTDPTPFGEVTVEAPPKKNKVPEQPRPVNSLAIVQQAPLLMKNLAVQNPLFIHIN